jgi:iron complex outermembrane receptor protein
MMVGMRTFSFERKSPTATVTALGLFIAGSSAAAVDISPAIAHIAAQAYDIPAGPMADALNALAGESGAQLVYDAALTRRVRTRGVSGIRTLDEALRELLSGTGLAYEVDPSGASVSIVLAQAETVRSDTISADAAPLPPIDIGAERPRPRAPAETPRAIMSAPLAQATVDAEALADKRPAVADTTQLLRDVPGVDFYEAGGISRIPTIHGLNDDRIKILVGGAEITSACANHMNPPLSYIDPSQVAKIDVLAGLTPVSMGGDSIAGTIRVEPLPPIFARTGEAVHISGSASAFYRSVNRGVTISGNATVATDNFSFGYNGAWTRGSDYEVGGGAHPYASLALAADPIIAANAYRTTVAATLFQAQNHSGTIAYRNDGHLLVLRGGLQRIPYQGYVNELMDMSKNFSTNISLDYRGSFAWGGVQALVYHRDIRHEMDILSDRWPLFGMESHMTMQTKGSDSGYRLQAETKASEQDVVRVGSEFHRQQEDDWWPPYDKWSDGSIIPFASMSYVVLNNAYRNRIGTFAEWERQWDREWSTLLGVRNDVVWMNNGDVRHYSTRNSLAVALANASNARARAKTDVNFDFTASIRYKPDDTSAWELGVSRKTRSPSLYERYAWYPTAMFGWFGDGNNYIGDVNLAPEVAYTVTGSARWNDPDDRLWSVKVSPYFSYVNNFIGVRQGLQYLTPSVMQRFGFTTVQFVNHDARLYGVDLSSRLTLADDPELGRVTASGSLSFVRGEKVGAGLNSVYWLYSQGLRSGNHSLYHIMPVNGRIALEHKLGGWSSAIELRLVGRKTEIDPVRLEPTTSGYALVNIRTGYEWKHVRIDVGVENLFDQLYYPPLGGKDVTLWQGQGGAYGPRPYPSAVPGPGRSVYAGVTVKF